MQPTQHRIAETTPRRANACIEARRLRQDLRQSLRENGLLLAFQPRRRLTDDTLLGAEAQLRWPCRGRGVLQAAAIQPLIDACNLGTDLLAWTLNAACTTAATWPQGIVSLSVPAAAARNGSLLTLTGEALARTGLDPERLELMLHDSACDAECETTQLSLAALRDLGVGAGIEEYGRSRACLITLKHLPLSTIKLDRSLVRDAMCDPAAAAMARALADYAHALDITVVAALETQAHRTLLQRLGCDVGIERAGNTQ